MTVAGDEDPCFEALLRDVADAPDVSVVQPAHLPYEGMQFGRYRLIRRLARGGMGAVYLAHVAGVHGFERWVALKVMDSSRASEPEFVSMFLDEARIAARIEHTHVCQVFDFGVHGEVLFIVMEYLRGASLSTILSRAGKTDGVPWWFAARVVADAARGLHAAHELVGDDGLPLLIVHRDVGPPNIVVQYDGISKVVDFGIAKARGRSTASTRDQLKGKLPYMAPEQITRQSVDRRTDIWALGVTLWEAIVGRALFSAGNEGATVMDILHASIENPVTHAPECPPALGEVVLRTLERDVGMRTATAAELADALEQCLHQATTLAGHGQVAQWMATHLQTEQRELHAIEQAGAVTLGSAARAERIARTTEADSPRPRRWRPRLGVSVAVAIVFAAVAAVLAMLWPALTDGRNAVRPSASTLTETRDAREVAGSGVEAPSLAASASVAPAPLSTVAEAPALEAPAPAEPALEAPAPVEPAPEEEPITSRSGSRGDPASERQAPGYLSLLVIPSSRVTWQGRSLGYTPLRALALPPGRHSFEVEAQDGRRKRITVRIRPGRTTREVLAL